MNRTLMRPSVPGGKEAPRHRFRRVQGSSPGQSRKARTVGVRPRPCPRPDGGPSMNRVASTCLISCLFLAGAGAPAQDGGLAVRIETKEEGLHRISGEMLKSYVQLDRVNPERLSITHDGQAVPIEV